MATNNILVSLFLSAISVLVHLNTCFKLVIARKTNLSKRKKAVLATIMEAVGRKQALTKRSISCRWKRFWVKPGRTDMWWKNMIQCTDEDGKKNFSKGAVHGACRRTSTIHFAKSELTKAMKFSRKKGLAITVLYIYIYIFWVSFSLRFLDWVICFFLIVCFNARSHCS